MMPFLTIGANFFPLAGDAHKDQEAHSADARAAGFELIIANPGRLRLVEKQLVNSRAETYYSLLIIINNYKL